LKRERLYLSEKSAGTVLQKGETTSSKGKGSLKRLVEKRGGGAEKPEPRSLNEKAMLSGETEMGTVLGTLKGVEKEKWAVRVGRQ